MFQIFIILRMKTSPWKIAAENRSTNNRSRWSASQNLWYVGAKNRSREIYLPRGVGCDQCAVKVIITIRYMYIRVENGSRQQAHNTRTTHTSVLPPVLSHYSVCVTLPGIPVDAIYRQYIGYTRVAPNFYHDLIDRFSMSDALLSAFLFDSRGGTVVTERAGGGGEQGESSLPFFSVNGHIYVYANL